jgi:uncharacterized protein YjbI with pentapeptide repeats
MHEVQPLIQKEYANQNLQKTIFRNEDLRHAVFLDTDLRGTDFSGADLTGASFINVKTGISPINILLILIAALLIAALCGYTAMLAGTSVQTMLISSDWKIRIIGIITILMIILFIVFTYCKGGRVAIIQSIVPVFFFIIVVGGISFFSKAGTGKEMLYELLALLSVVAMLVVGTVARATAGILSNLLFMVVALVGCIYSKSTGGGIGTLVMAIGYTAISKRAFSGAQGFETTRKIAALFTVKLGTSFRNCKMIKADFSKSKKVRNADFSNADFFLVHWGNCKKINCIM